MLADLEGQACQFAERLTDTVRALAPGCAPFEAEFTQHTERVWIRQSPDTGIPLSVEGEPIITLKAVYQCSWDGKERYLATDDSQIKVHAGAEAAGEPLFRYHYRRTGHEDLPSAHIHVHAQRRELSEVLARTGERTVRGKRRARNEGAPPMQDLHFPVGGHRFRPGLEDVLEMLVNELGVDHPDDALVALRNGRETWRRTQTRTAVRDSPLDAVAELEDLGYTITFDETVAVPDGRPERLRDF